MEAWIGVEETYLWRWVLWWRIKSSGLFDIRSYYKALRDPSRVLFPCKSIWCGKAPRQVCFFIFYGQRLGIKFWLVIILFTGPILWLVGACVDVVGSWWTISFCTALWLEFCGVFVFWWHWVGSLWAGGGVIIWLVQWIRKLSSDIWNLVPLCLMWTLWHERNRRTFEDAAKSECQLLDCFISLLFDWSKALGFTTSILCFRFCSIFVFKSYYLTLCITWSFLCSCFMHPKTSFFYIYYLSKENYYLKHPWPILLSVFASLNNYLCHVCLIKLLVCRDGFIKYWVDGNMLTMDTTTKIFKILRQPDCKYLTQVCFSNYSSMDFFDTKLHFWLYLNGQMFWLYANFLSCYSFLQIEFLFVGLGHR